MALPRPVWPSAALADLLAFFKTRTKHQLGFAVASLFIPLYFVALFFMEARTQDYKPPDIVFVQNYKLNRTDAEIRAQQVIDEKQRKIDEAELKRLQAEHRAPFIAMDKAMDRWGL